MNTTEIQFTEEEEQIYSCLNLSSPKSFFLFAGAGSGKTHSLVQVLRRFKVENVRKLRLNGQQVGIITYTNAASDEINRRLEFDHTFLVSTIHSFSWDLIKPYQDDIKKWVKANLSQDIIELKEQEKGGRSGTKASADRIAKIESKEKRLKAIDTIKGFIYNPNGANNHRDSLNHSDVLNIASDFLANKPLLQKILIKRFPILLIDESQDTKKELIESLFKVQANFPDSFTLGLFGDTMQRIYMDGKADLGIQLPDTWKTPQKTINYRCPVRVVSLINKIRTVVDKQVQIAHKSEEGFVRLFIIDSKLQLEKDKVENAVAQKMFEITSDNGWRDLRENVKCLTLEHHMAANRSGFSGFFEPLYRSTKDTTGLLDGSMQGVSFLLKQLLPLIKAKKENDGFAVANVIKSFSPLLDKAGLQNSKSQIENIKKAHKAIEELQILWGDSFDKDPTLYEVLRYISKNDILVLPEILSIIIDRKDDEVSERDESFTEDKDELVDAWEAALKVPFSQLELYNEYISDNSAFGTHQGVKGLEFPRVMVILDDEEARGFLFSYEKLLGAKEMTETDKKNLREGKETSIDRTRRLFYVACSRAETSLSIVAYTENPKAVRDFALSQEWFNELEIIEFNEKLI